MRLNPVSSALLRSASAISLYVLAAALLLCLPALRVEAEDRGASVPLALVADGAHDASVRLIEDGTWEVRTTGADPYVFTERLPSLADAGRYPVLTFEYATVDGTDSFQAFALPPLSEERSVKGPGLVRGAGWSDRDVDLRPLLASVPGPVNALRLDFGSEAGKVVRIRALRLREENAAERAETARQEEKRARERAREEALRAYLMRAFPCRVTSVTVDAERVTVTGGVSGERGPLFAAALPIWADAFPGRLGDDPAGFVRFEPITPGADGGFTVTVKRQGAGGDALLHRWAVVRRRGERVELLSHARYADDVKPLWELPEEKPRGRKGVGALWLGRPVVDLDDLGISAVTVNIVISGFMRTTPGEGRTPFTYAGHNWYAADEYLAQLDRTLLEAARRRVVVSAIVLIPQAEKMADREYGRRVAHPDADPAGIYVMPNLTGEEGAMAYGAALDFLARRYGRPDGRYGRIHHWILHNEVNAGWEWTNAGEKTPLLYMDQYHRSMRMAHLISRQYDRNAKAFISLTHHWAQRSTPHLYSGRELLEILTDYCRAEGDFDWALAYHPYPENLFNPRTWEDKSARFDFDTPRITFRNLEVLDRWMKQPRMLFQGTRRRTVHLTEQGLNSRDYGEASLRDQAAGMAYAWNKLKFLDSIEVFHYHNWVDNRAEGGLRLGLRRFPDDPEDPMGRKPSWYVYQSLDTGREEEVTAPYKAVVGVEDWAQVRYTGEIR